ncbi:chorismate synthase [Helcobacillus massiliensis]|uniref:Chorismate synthase n=1 Tax=Helcobacillus massiliensis TaxID=521392 RepID=A0A839QRQ2_9MICO|nr:chorismate synthase [Helcobacillus massiliensis]MCG7426432.1 chorismate synthase [Helcobacillus sp. ACRRO]MBB3022348.1 chorismate synthase [Helcobacillus massiliensis]MCT1556987.1 chorismate synthase [Helcobacillus massiliensis]MCT2035376.1 chorismate synthase [Helcobacillus massiliensis]MCT2331409.1 chorismate synthase [Helcobacillus massiliensis]
MLTWLTAGESHGPSLTALIDGFPAGVTITSDDVRRHLSRRRLGYGRGSRQKFEQDALRILGGVRHGTTLGSPIAMEIGNSEWPKWEKVMSPDPVDPADLLIDAGTGDEREIARNRALTRPRPGHADLAGMAKYGFEEARPVLERASARETAARVAIGAFCAALLEQAAGIRLVSHVRSVGTAAIAADAPVPTPDDEQRLNDDPVRCLDPEASARMVAEIDAAKKDGDTLGGVVEVLAYGVPVGLGSHTQWDRRLDGRLAQAIMSIQAFKGVEIGDGFATAARRGSAAHDEILTGGDGPAATSRATNRAGGLEGGISNGQVIAVRGALKPISTVPRALRTIDVATGEESTANHQRSDVAAVAPAAVIAEAMVAITLADALLEKAGGDSVAEIRRHLEATAALQADALCPREA